MSQEDRFPPTAPWVRDKVAGDEKDREIVCRHLMEVYYEPLQAYFRGSSYRWMGDAEDIVAEFFSSWLGRDSFYAGWRERGARLRYWLIGSFKLFLKERRRGQERGLPRAAVEVGDVGVEADEERTIDRAFARSLVRRSCEITRRVCEAEGLSDHWQILIGHHLEGLSYRDLAERHGVGETQARGMARTARERYRRIVRGLLGGAFASEGTADPGARPADVTDSRRDERIDLELRSLLEAIDS